jgi:hypothetical protein
MSISALGNVAAATIAAAAAPPRTTGFDAQVNAALGHHHGHGHRVQETGAVGGAAGTPPSLADSTRSLIGDVFGALGADTPTEVSAQQAVQAYQATN